MVRARPIKSLAIVAMIGAAFCWASGSLVTKSLVGEIDPFQLLFLQLLASATVLWFVILLTGKRIQVNSSLIKISLLGILEPGLAYLCSTVGLKSASVGTSSLIFATEPAMVAILSWPILREKLSPKIAVSLLLSILGVSLTVLENEVVISGSGLIGLSTLLAALYVVMNQRLSDNTPIIVRVCVQQTVGVLLAGVIVILLCKDIIILSNSQIIWIIISGLIQYGAAFLLYLIAVQQLQVTIATLFLALIPLFSILGGQIFLNESLTLIQYFGGAVILGALVMISVQSMSLLQSEGYLVQE